MIETTTGCDKVDKAIDEIDDALFSGDTFWKYSSVDNMRDILLRWKYKLDDIEGIMNEDGRF